MAAGILSAAICSTTVAEAQGAAEVFFGYSYLQADPGGATFDGNPIVFENSTMHGAEVTGTYWATPRLGLDFTVAMHFGRIAVPPDLDLPAGAQARIDFRQTALMAGPRVRLSSPGAAMELSARAAFGQAFGDVQATAGLVGFDAKNTVLAISAGASLSAWLGQSLNYRIVQPEVYITQFGDATQTSFRVSTGLVWVFNR